MTGSHAPLDQPDPVATALADVAHAIVGAEGVDLAFEQVAAFAVDLVPGCDHSGLAILHRGRLRAAGANDDVSLAVEAIQEARGEGPGLEVLTGGGGSELVDLTSEPRWPGFVERVLAETPVRSVLSLRLEVQGRATGALDLYGDRPDAFGARGMQVASLLGAHAAVGLASAREVDQLRAALESRDVIATAKGILMARQGISDDEAFSALCRASRRSNIRVRDLAEQLVQSYRPGSSTGSPDLTP